MRPLTERQLEVARLIAYGLTNDEIAERLRIDPRTVRSHSDTIRQKLGVDTRRRIGGRMRELKLL